MKKYLQKLDTKFFLQKIAKKNRGELTLSEKEYDAQRAKNAKYFEHNVMATDITIDAKKITNYIDIAAKILNENGVVIIKNFVDRDIALKAQDEFFEFMEEKNVLNVLEDQEFYETEDCLIQYGGSKLKNYAEYAKYPKMVCVIRRKGEEEIDGGMLDLFGINKGLTHHKENQNKCLEKTTEVATIIRKQTRKKIERKQTNLYYSNSVLNPRGWHVDTLYESYKSFLYLRDCKTIECGPYSFIPKSHLKRKQLKENIANNMNYNKESVYSQFDVHVDNEVGLQLLGEAGTLIISNQNGLHRGHPQKRGSKRLIMVGNWFK